MLSEYQFLFDNISHVYTKIEKWIRLHRDFRPTDIGASADSFGSCRCKCVDRGSLHLNLNNVWASRTKNKENERKKKKTERMNHLVSDSSSIKIFKLEFDERVWFLLDYNFRFNSLWNFIMLSFANRSSVFFGKFEGFKTEFSSILGFFEWAQTEMKTTE